LSHAVWQQNESFWQTQSWHLQLPQVGVGLWVQPSEHEPQSLAQLPQFSVLASQTWSPQNGHLPQSFGQLLQVSPEPHWPLPQSGLHLPQSCAQLLQSSPAPQ
jgi:hypothetical protein